MDLQEQYDKLLAEKEAARKALVLIARELTPCPEMTTVEAGRRIERAYRIANTQRKKMPGEKPLEFPIRAPDVVRGV